MNFSKNQLIELLPQSNYLAGLNNQSKSQIDSLAVGWQNYFSLYNLDDLADHYLIDIDYLEDLQTVYQYYKQYPQDSDGQVKASLGTCIIVHGYMDHSGLYQHLIRAKLAQGWDVLIYDLLGHGLSSGKGYSINSFSQYAQQLQQVLQFLAVNDQSNNWLLIGQSTGCAIIMEHALNPVWLQFKQIKYRILLAPLLKSCDSLLVKIQYYLLKHFVTQVKRTFSNNTHNLTFLDFIRYQDPLTINYINVSWVGAMLNWEKAFFNYNKSQYPIFIVQGDDDDTVDWRYNLAVIENKFEHVRKKILPGAKHHLVNESDVLREQVFNCIGDEYESS